MVCELTTLRREIDRRKGQRDLLATELERSMQLMDQLLIRKVRLGRVQTILRTVAKMTQDQLEYRVSEIASLALSTIFPGRYKVTLKFVERRGKTEAEITLTDPDGNDMDPMDSNGGGVVDIVAFALRLSLWSLNKNRTRNLIVLDEPFQHLSKDLHPKAGKLLRELSRKLDLQIILVTQESAVTEFADKTFEVWKKGKESFVK